MTTELNLLTREVIRFRDARDWKQFHNAKDLALALSIESAEVNELFLWKSASDVNKKRLAEELADVFIYTLLLANETGIDINEAATAKLKSNARKYPVRKAKGNAKKYRDL